MTAAGGPGGIDPALRPRWVLGFPLQSRAAPDDLLGWRVAERREDLVRIETGSWLMTAHVLVKLEREQLWFATRVRYEHPLARLIWPPVSLLHRRAAISLVRAGLGGGRHG